MGKFGHLLLKIMEQLAVVQDLSDMIYILYSMAIFHGFVKLPEGSHRMMIVTKQQCWALGNDMVMTIYDNLSNRVIGGNP